MQIDRYYNFVHAAPARLMGRNDVPGNIASHAVLNFAVITVAPAFPVLSMAFHGDELSLHVFNVF